MHLNRLDLNLLVSLNALLMEQSVTRAAALLSVSQPAMSGALSRLRDHFGDELIQRSGRKMVLTPFGAELMPKVRELVGMVSTMVNTRPRFDPMTSDRTFTLVTSGYVLAVFLPLLTMPLLEAAPSVTVDAQLRSFDHEARMSSGMVDLFIVPKERGLVDVPSAKLFEDEYVCIACRDNDLIGDTLSLETYLELGHVVRTRPRASAITYEDARLAELGLRRKEVLRLPSFEAIPRVVAGTKMIASMQRRLAEEAVRIYPLRMLRNPLDIPKLSIVMQWPAFRNDDPGSRWLRSAVLATAKQRMHSLGTRL